MHEYSHVQRGTFFINVMYEYVYDGSYALRNTCIQIHIYGILYIWINHINKYVQDHI
jgi:hypothetical protein